MGADGGEGAAAAAEAAATRAAVQCMMDLTSVPPGTSIIPHKTDAENAGGRSMVGPDEKNWDRCTVMKHVEVKEDGQAGVLMFDSNEPCCM